MPHIVLLGDSIFDNLTYVEHLPEDYANPIEPSAIGGKKIVDAIWGTISSDAP